jgi:hypothetical protein
LNDVEDVLYLRTQVADLLKLSFTRECGAVSKIPSQSSGCIKICMISIMLSLCLLACTNHQKVRTNMAQVKTMDLSQYPDAPPNNPIHLLFIHHSTGGQLLADKGPDVGVDCIYKSHPNGGGLRRLLEQNNYIVHEASYGSLNITGDKTDIMSFAARELISFLNRAYNRNRI